MKFEEQQWKLISYQISCMVYWYVRWSALNVGSSATVDNNQWSGLVRYSHYKKSTSNEQAYINKSQFQEVQPSLILRFKYTLTRLPQCQRLTIFDNIHLRVFLRYMGFLITGIDKKVSPEQSCEGYYLQVLRNLTPFWVLHGKNEVPVVCCDVNPKEFFLWFPRWYQDVVDFIMAAHSGPRRVAALARGWPCSGVLWSLLRGYHSVLLVIRTNSVCVMGQSKSQVKRLW